MLAGPYLARGDIVSAAQLPGLEHEQPGQRILILLLPLGPILPAPIFIPKLAHAIAILVHRVALAAIAIGIALRRDIGRDGILVRVLGVGWACLVLLV